MTPERWQHIEKIFQTALDLAPDERVRFITVACTGDADLRRDVETLLTQHEAGDDFVDRSLLERSGEPPLTSVDNNGDPMLGHLLGAYRIEREIGRGGMGTVYLASRADNAFQKRVAIKVVKRGMDTDFILSRFRRERQILASLDHVNIARLLDGGSTNDGRPYFVMEYIEGEPLYQYCDARRLGVRERLRLFCQVCDAVDYAHQSQVIHRDIKPSNILVHASGAPKLFDFGIAKLLNPELASDTAPETATAMRLMTVEYASPEQVQGQPVTLLSDLYSLGVLLYELLTGHRPYRFRSRLLHEMARIIAEEEPEYPSVAVNRFDSLLPVAHVDPEAMTIGHLCEMRKETPDSLRLELSGSLDIITLKTLRKEPAERYQSAAALREDIERFLAGHTVFAKPYDRMPARRAAAVEIPAEAESKEKSIAVLPFKLIGKPPSADTDDEYLGIGLADALITRLSNVRSLSVRPTSAILRFGGEDVYTLAAGRELGVDFVLDGRIKRAGERIRISLQLLDIRSGSSVWAHQFDERFTDVLNLEDAISDQVGKALITHLTSEERSRLKKRGTDNPEAFEAYLRGRYYWNAFTVEGFAKALICYNRAIAHAPDYALAYAGIADYYNWLGVYAVLPFAETSAAAKEAALKAISIDETLAEAYSALGFATLMHDFDWETAESHLKRAIELNPKSVTGRLWHCYFLGIKGQFEEALAEARRALELDPFTAIVHHALCWTYYHARRYSESIAATRKLAEAEPQSGLAQEFLCVVLSHNMEYDEAIEAGVKGISLLGRSPYTLSWLAAAYAAADQREQAQKLIDEIREISKTRYSSPYLLAMVYCSLGDEESAFLELERALEIRDARLIWLGVDPHFDRLRSDPRLNSLLRQTNNPAAALTIEGESATGEKSIAVIPFKLIGKHTSDDTGDEYLGFGLADALITRLSSVQRFIVRPTSSVLRYGDNTYDPLVAGRELGVDFLVDGNIRRVGDRFRFTAQLLSVGEGSMQWAGRFDEKAADVLQLEDSISEKVAEALIPHLTGDERLSLAKRGTDNPEAFEAYLRGRYHWSTFTVEGFAKSHLCYQRAIALDPNYAAAYTGLADYYNWLGVYSVMPFNECALAAKEAASKAIRLDDKLAEAYTALGFATLCYDFDWRTGEELHRRAIKLNPNYSTAHAWYSFQLIMEKRFEEALSATSRAIELDPLSPINRHTRAWCYYQARRLEESRAEYGKLVAAEPSYGMGHFGLSWTLRQIGEHEEAINEAALAVELLGRSPFIRTALAAAYASAGRSDDAREILRQLTDETQERYVSPYHLALVHIQLGELDRALELLELATDTGDAWIVWLGTEPQVDPLRSHPRFKDLLRRINHPTFEASASGQAS